MQSLRSLKLTANLKGHHWHYLTRFGGDLPISQIEISPQVVNESHVYAFA